MSPTDLLSLIPTQYLPYATAAVTVCGLAQIIAPHPAAEPQTSAGKAYAAVYGAFSWVALNVGKARNAG